MSEEVYQCIESAERTVGINKMAKVRYLLQQPPEKTLNNMYSSLFKTYEAEERRPHPMAYLVWAVNCVGDCNAAKRLAELGGCPDGWSECDPDPKKDPVLLMRRKIVEMDCKLSDDEDFVQFVNIVLASYMHNDNPENFPATADGRMSFYSALEKRGIIGPDNLEPLCQALKEDKKDLPADELAPITTSSLRQEPLFHVGSKFGKGIPSTAGIDDDPNALIQRMQMFLRAVYDKWPDIPDNEWFWPKLDRTQYITLALVFNRDFSRDDEFTHASLRNSEDDIPNYKEEIKYDEVFPRVMGKPGFRVLVSGRPGCGKTVLLNKVSKDWAKKECLRDVPVVLHIALRDLVSVSTSPTLQDVLKKYISDDAEREEFAHLVQDTLGEGICFALDGLDEYPYLLRGNDFISGLIRGSFLPKASVIMTSRPTASQKVRQLVKRHVEIIGFLPQQITEYINEYYKGDPNKAKKLGDYLDSHQNVMGMCYLPLHLAMIIYVYQHCESRSLPETESEMYRYFVSHSVVRHCMREEKDKEVDIDGLEEIDLYLSKEEVALFHSICNLALETKLKSLLIFTRKDVLKRNICSVDESEIGKIAENGFGVLSSHEKRVQTGVARVFSFQHLTIQEFLGAYYLSFQPESVQMQYLQNYGDRSDMQEVWKFFCGLMKSNPNFPNCFEKLVACNPRTGADTLFLLRCAFESQPSPSADAQKKPSKLPSLSAVALKETSKLASQIIFTTRDGRLNVSNIRLNSPDCSAVGYVIANAPDHLRELLMNYCQVGPDGIEALKRQLDAFGVSQLSSIFRLHIRSQLNPVGEKGGFALVEILKKMPMLHELRLYGNELKSEKLVHLTPIISKMTHIRTLVLTKNKLGPDTGKYISQMIENMPNLMLFYASYNPLETAGLRAMMPGLRRCSQIERFGVRGCSLDKDSGKLLAELLETLPNLSQLELYDNDLGDQGVCDVFPGLQKSSSIEQVSFTKNNVGDFGMCKLAEIVRTSHCLKQIRLYYNPVSSRSRQALYEAAKTRERLGLPEVLYAI